MKQVFLLVLVIQVAVTCIRAAIPQVEEALDDEEQTTPPTTPAPLQKNPSQCLYDHKQFRVNRDCNVELPPTCLKGSLVVTQHETVYEMCCCQYSNTLYHTKTTSKVRLIDPKKFRKAKCEL